MNRILVFGSLNIDYTYTLDHIVKEGETITSTGLRINAGGKGANQSASLSKAGLCVWNAGIIGRDGSFLKCVLSSYGVNTSLIRETEEDNTGKAIIQLDKNGQNSIILYPGANRMIESEYIDEVLSSFSSGDWLVLQNEINALNEIMEKAKKKGMRICINPSPFDSYILTLPLEKADMIVVNEIEGRALAGLGEEAEYMEILSALTTKYKNAEIILTVGEDGAFCSSKGKMYSTPAQKTAVSDTTAAGDTFLGYYLASRERGYSEKEALEWAGKASAIAVSRKGAMVSIPFSNEVFPQ